MLHDFGEFGLGESPFFTNRIKTTVFEQDFLETKV